MIWIIRLVSDSYNEDRTKDGTAYDLHGPVDAPVVVLIHGLGLCRDLWSPHLDALSQRYRVINYDLYGHGDSAPLPESSLASIESKKNQSTGETSPATLSIYADQLASLLDHLALEQVAVVGFSIGGMINRRFAMDYADRVSALVILNSPHNRGDELQAQVEQRAKKVVDEGVMATLPDAVKRWFTAEYLDNRMRYSEQNNHGADLVKGWREKVDARSYAQAAWVLANGVRELITPSIPIDAPALVMTCENDSGSTPAMSRDIATEIHGAKCQIVPSLQHLGLMQEPDAFVQPILAFLDGNLI